MKLLNFIKHYNIDIIKDIEENQDIQFLALKKSWLKICKLNGYNDSFKKEFLFLIIQNALISYQLSGKGELRWQEFGNLAYNYFKEGNFKSNKKRWFGILKDCRYNCRLANMKMKRIDKIDTLRQELDNIDTLDIYYQNMTKFNNYLATSLNQKTNAKTIVFSTKMFGYASRIIFNKFIPYPFDVEIPIDSRLTKIFKYEQNICEINNKEIRLYFEKLSQQSNIPPLHLDSILWIKYYKKIQNFI